MENHLDIKSMTLTQMEEQFASLSQPAYRAKQVYQWLHKGVRSYDQMTNLPQSLRKVLSEQYPIYHVEIVRKLVSRLDGTVKYLYRLRDGETIETVVMHYRHGTSICLSTQAGCRMGCTFCATGMGGLRRNLTASEMLSQITAAQDDLNIRISHIVLMGMGEPMDNFEHVSRFLALVGDENGLNIGARHISLSTCGHVDGIRKLMRLKSQITLSVSLHAPNDSLRSRMMPINRKWNIAQLMAACREYIAETGRRISFEYTLIEGVNNTPECARQLAGLLHGMLCHVNLIPVNEVSGKRHRAGSKVSVYQFQRILQEYGINATVRRTLGSDINASCGQLRRQEAT